MFRQRGGLGPAVLALVVMTFLAVFLGLRVHVSCSRSADRCTYETFGVGGSRGSVRLSTVGALTVDRDGHGLSRLVFATTNGDASLGSGWDNVAEGQKSQLSARFDAWRTTSQESFEGGYGPSAALVLMVALTVAGVALWIARGGPSARVVVEPQEELVTVTLRPHPWVGRATRTIRKARLRAWKGAFELYDDEGQVVPLPVATTDSRGRALEALLER